MGLEAYLKENHLNTWQRQWKRSLYIGVTKDIKEKTCDVLRDWLHFNSTFVLQCDTQKTADAVYNFNEKHSNLR